MEATEDGVRIIRIPLPVGPRWTSPARWAQKVRFLIRAAALIQPAKYDVVHVYSTLGAFVLPLVAGRRSKWVHELQTGAVSSPSRLSRQTQNRVRAWQGTLFDANLTVTRVLGERIFGGNGTCFDVVPAGVNLRAFAPGLGRDLRVERGIPGDAVVFVHGGVLEKERGTEVVVLAFAQALRRDRRLWLLMPGRGAQLGQLRHLTSTLDASQRIWLPGYVPYRHMPRVFAAADVGVSYLPPVEYYEGQPPMKVMEYLACGLPVIASDVASHRVLVTHGVNGLLSRPGVTDLAKAMLDVAADPELRKALAARARPSVLHLSWDRIAADRLLPVYQRILREAG